MKFPEGAGAEFGHSTPEKRNDSTESYHLSISDAMAGFRAFVAKRHPDWDETRIVARVEQLVAHITADAVKDERNRLTELDRIDVHPIRDMVSAARRDGRSAIDVACEAYDRLVPLRNPETNGSGPTPAMRQQWLASLLAAAARKQSKNKPL